MTALDFFARYRVRLGYLLAAVVLWLARPTLHSILLGAAVGIVGLCIRVYAAGYLHKQKALTVTGPYGYTRNPLYFGSSFLGAGVAVATHSLWSAGLLIFYFALVYSFVMRREEMELRQQHGAAFDAYAAAVPLFLPRLTVATSAGGDAGGFSWRQYRENHEYRAAGGFLLVLLVLLAIWRLRRA